MKSLAWMYIGSTLAGAALWALGWFVVAELATCHGQTVDVHATATPVPTPIKGWVDAPTYFEDMEVVETVTRKKLSVREVAELIDKLPNVKSVLIACDPPRRFSIETLAYPQYADRYELTQAEWRELQGYCQQKLNDATYATETVVAHWKSIAAGKPPFGLQVKP